MSFKELDKLAHQIESLLALTKQLQSENQALRRQLAIASQERARLQELNHQATIKVKNIIQQLKEEMI